jgi:hypothetical protein
MKRTLNHLAIESMRLMAGACGLIAILALAPMSVAQQSAAAKAAASNPVASPTTQSAVAVKPTARPVAEEESAAPNSPSNQGIKVHGHWVLQVKNADGTLGERREFDNSLVGFGTNTSGDQVLAALLTGTATVGDLAVAFISGDATGVDPSTLCEGNRAATPRCFMLVARNDSLAGGLNSDLQSGLNDAVYFSPSVKIVLSGNFGVPATLGTAGSITVVQTYAGLCSVPGINGFMQSISGQINTFQQSTVAPASCNYNGSLPTTPITMGALTSTVITSGGVATPLPVTAGQIVQVTVTISFS